MAAKNKLSILQGVSTGVSILSRGQTDRGVRRAFEQANGNADRYVCRHKITFVLSDRCSCAAIRLQTAALVNVICSQP